MYLPSGKTAYAAGGTNGDSNPNRHVPGNRSCPGPLACIGFGQTWV